MNDDQRYISAFLQVFETKAELLEEVGAVEDLANLNQMISQMVDESDEEVADTIGIWCKKYPKIRDTLRSIINRKPEPQPTKKEEQEPKLLNRYPELPESLKKRIPNSQPPRQ
ncbi:MULTISPECIES: hypothetical protein [unclassified Microcoleus]|uniref:hypothetical protein n=1 Tax=unclassified Microcoleus TaxID=2642155 RepID=UPI002FD2B4C0